MDLLDDLGPQLRALSGDQPTQPGDRVPGVTRRARRIRATRIAVAAAVTFAIAAPAGIVVSSMSRNRSTQYANLTEWPDRSVPEYRGIGVGALTALRTTTGAVVTDVHWLYRARVRPDIDSSPMYVAAFTAQVDGRLTLVAATSVGPELDRHGPSTSTTGTTGAWDTSDQVALDSQRLPAHVGVYLPYNTSGRTANVAVVIADPRARRLSWHVAPLPDAPATSAAQTTARSSDGVFVADLGAVTGSVSIALDDEPGASPLSLGASQPFLLGPADVEVTPIWRELMSGFSVTSEESPGRWSTTRHELATGVAGPGMVAIVRCYGGGVLHVALTAGAATQPIRSGDVACDDQSHIALGPVDISSDLVALTMTSDRLQVVRFDYGSSR